MMKHKTELQNVDLITGTTGFYYLWLQPYKHTTNQNPGSNRLAFHERLNVYPVAIKCICTIKKKKELHKAWPILRLCLVRLNSRIAWGGFQTHYIKIVNCSWLARLSLACSIQINNIFAANIYWTETHCWGFYTPSLHPLNISWHGNDQQHVKKKSCKKHRRNKWARV